MPLFGTLFVISLLALLLLAGILITLGEMRTALLIVGLLLAALTPLGGAAWWARDRGTSGSGDT
jgi:hypothetical protein